MRIIVLTSSRADYGIYLPLLKRLRQDPFFQLDLIAFGTHLSPYHGLTIEQIKADGFQIYASLETLLAGDSPEALVGAQGLTTIKFASFWATEKEVDLILCLGDRFEMFAAVMAAVPFQIPIAHIHGGETTLGAIDNIYRHAMTLAATWHFTATQASANRVKQITGQDEGIYYVGALSLDSLLDIPLLTVEEFHDTYQIDLSIPTILVTFHPETVSFEKNLTYIDALTAAMARLNYQIVITMPNADTLGNAIRKKLLEFAAGRPTVYTIESFGTRGYFSCMKACALLLGNTSSGIIEAASFGKYVLNLGDRQKGRERSPNVFDCPINEASILEGIARIEKLPPYISGNIYGKQHAAEHIIHILKQHYD